MALYIPECSQSPSSKAAATEEARRTLRYVEPLRDARTPLEDFFSILLAKTQQMLVSPNRELYNTHNEFHAYAQSILRSVT